MSALPGPVSSSVGSAPDARARLRRRIVAGGAILVLAFSATAGFDIWHLHRQTLAATDRELTNLARAIAEQTARSLQTVNVLLRDTAQWYAADGDKLPAERVHEALASRDAGLPQVLSLAIVDAQGVLRFSSRIFPAPALDVKDRASFIAQRDGATEGLFISDPTVSQTDHRTELVLSRRLVGAGNRFRGVVNAVVDIEDFQDFYRGLQLGAGGTVVLVRSDGTLIAREPPAPSQVGKQFPDFAAAANADAANDESATLFESPVDHVRRFVAVAAVRDSPLLVMASRDAAVALGPWRDQALGLAAWTLLVSVLAALLIAAIVRQLRQLETGERALRESEERYTLAMEGSNEGHWDWDLESDNLFLSANMRALHGQSGGDPMTTRADWLSHVAIHPDDQRRFDAAVTDHIEGRTPYFEVEYRVGHPHGEWRWILARGRCLRDAAGRATRFVGSASDVTARKQAEAEKDHLEIRLRQSQKLEAMGTLAGGIAHDFNNILGAVLGYGELAQKRAADQSAVRRYLDQVMHAGARAKVLVQQILAFSRSGAGARAPVHVQAVVEETLGLLKGSLPPRVHLEARLDAGDAAVLGDATQLHQVVMNLCANAVHAMDQDGTLSVALERVDVPGRRTLSHGVLDARSYVRLAVSDTGSGIPPSVLERMFDPFFTTKGVGEGTGLGLSLVHGIVADLGGAIDVATTLGQGTTFTVWLLSVKDTRRPAAESTRDLPRGNGEMVMVVDDERPLVMLLEEMLAELGYEPVGFESSVVALQAFQAEPHRFDAVVTDETMPDLSGTELAQAIHRIRAEIPVVLVSGYSGARLAGQAHAAGVSQVLRKPFEYREVADSLATVLKAAR
jgi:PAS domain S-box-containing protein